MIFEKRNSNCLIS